MKRRRESLLGAPVKQANVRLSIAFALVICCLALYLPLFGLTLLAMLLVERIILRRLPNARRWLGLDAAVVSTHREGVRDFTV